VKSLVTGGAGFIGSNLVDALVDRGDDVVVVDNLSTGRQGNVEPAIGRGAKLIVQDIRDADLVSSLVSHEQPDAIYHLAAQIDVRVSASKPVFDAEINVLGTINMLEAARSVGARKFVFASTGGAIYGDTEVLPTPESTSINSEAPYGQAKYAAEGYCDLWHRLHGLSTICMRFGNVYGPRQDPLGEAGVVAIFCGKLYEHGTPTVFGDGEQTRDYVSVADVVRAMMMAGDSDLNGPFNVGRGEETSVLQLVDQLDALGREQGILNGSGNFQAEMAPPRPGEVRRSCLDPSKTREVLGFQAEVDLEDGLRRTLEAVAP
jgi:UDP-glucose 4-epimerase